jgi:hypothetical protein
MVSGSPSSLAGFEILPVLERTAAVQATTVDTRFVVNLRNGKNRYFHSMLDHIFLSVPRRNHLFSSVDQLRVGHPNVVEHLLIVLKPKRWDPSRYAAEHVGSRREL